MLYAGIIMSVIGAIIIGTVGTIEQPYHDDYLQPISFKSFMIYVAGFTTGASLFLGGIITIVASPFLG
jgi:hypothetical protein